jgi:hypothetical protein
VDSPLFGENDVIGKLRFNGSAGVQD